VEAKIHGCAALFEVTPVAPNGRIAPGSIELNESQGNNQSQVIILPKVLFDKLLYWQFWVRQFQSKTDLTKFWKMIWKNDRKNRNFGKLLILEFVLIPPT